MAYAMQVDTLILGAGAAGMMCAAHAGRRVLIVDHAKAAGEKIRISGGGRCNFTNLHCTPEAFLSENPHFCKSALSRYSQWDFIELVDTHGIAWHEKTLGQLFCDVSAKDIIAMLHGLMQRAGAQLWLRSTAVEVTHDGHRYRVVIERDGQRTTVTADNLVIATGGKSIPKMGATGQAYDLARQFGLNVTDTRPALVPLTFSDQRFAALSGVAVPVRATANVGHFDEAMLFTHRGLSGPAILQASSYWRDGDEITISLDPEAALYDALRAARTQAGRIQLKTQLARHLPGRLVDALPALLGLTLTSRLGDQSDVSLREICDALSNWRLRPTGSEGYRTAEVTLGGVSTADLSSKTMRANAVPGLYFIGEAVDVTGWLGGYNFQWAWSSAMAAERSINHASG